MNERIKELWSKAGGHYNIGNQHTWPEYTITDPEKFVELIVRECGQVLVDNTPIVDLVEDWDRGYDRAMNDCIHHIYEHFGVKE